MRKHQTLIPGAALSICFQTPAEIPGLVTVLKTASGSRFSALRILHPITEMDVLFLCFVLNYAFFPSRMELE